ncbi:hypothetical protein [Pontibacter chinhatensis]|uniref:DKNYY family protein n=1 Tax=Pontibacter chinhatensis TaxID=1436961 RepID=A0A1I2LYK8_9BACT|nr:hypothetical protein [Pontibacter chinhatensis]SFF82216.1 hypothetical protein SAMN05421739_10115 [Pontibacter chinhatensis]
MRRALLLLVVALAGLVAACEDKYKDPDPKIMGYDYFPLEVGQYRVYDVMDIRFMSDVGDTSRFQLRERVDTTFVDQTGKLNYKIIRSVRANENMNWIDDSVMVVTKSDAMVMLTKNNTKYVKMVFPVKEGQTWLGDAYNNNTGEDYKPDPNTNKRAEYYLTKEDYTFENVGKPYTVNGNTFSNTATVIQGTPIETWIGLNDRKEVYAEGVGMVYRLFTRIVYCNASESKDCTYGIGYRLHGHERHEKLIDHGKE